jgi:ABC-2 type transport system ATP-binding protein
MKDELAIDVEGVTKRFGERIVVNHIGLQVRTGEIYGFLGPNGSGKTTFIRMLCGLLRADAGHGTCLGYDFITRSREIKRHVGYMTQQFSFYTDLSVRENLDFVARIYGMKNRREVVSKSIERLGLAGRDTQLAGQLSGGWKQRLALAACLLHEPQLLLLDEPTAGVDPKARRDFWEQIHQLAAEGLTILITTHYMDEAERCHRIAYLSYGNLLANGTVKEVIAQAKLQTWVVSGPDLPALSQALKKQPAVAQTVPFGNTLHVSGEADAPVEKALRETCSPQHEWRQIPSGLEDVFIHLMEASKDNFRENTK